MATKKRASIVLMSHAPSTLECRGSITHHMHSRCTRVAFLGSSGRTARFRRRASSTVSSVDVTAPDGVLKSGDTLFPGEDLHRDSVPCLDNARRGGAGAGVAPLGACTLGRALVTFSRFARSRRCLSAVTAAAVVDIFFYGWR